MFLEFYVKLFFFCRCRNSGIVGVKQGISSRGSSGIGSDLAPSPERQDGQSSSGNLNFLILFSNLKRSCFIVNSPVELKICETIQKKYTGTYFFYFNILIKPYINRLRN